MNEKGNSFIFYPSFYEAIKNLDGEVRLAVMDAIAEYAIWGEVIELDPIPQALFTLMKPQIDANTKRREDGKKGGRPKRRRLSEDITSGYENEKPVDTDNDNQWLPEDETSGYENEKPQGNQTEPNANVNNNNKYTPLNPPTENLGKKPPPVPPDKQLQHMITLWNKQQHLPHMARSKLRPSEKKIMENVCSTFSADEISQAIKNYAWFKSDGGKKEFEVEKYYNYGSLFSFLDKGVGKFCSDGKMNELKKQVKTAKEAKNMEKKKIFIGSDWFEWSGEQRPFENNKKFELATYLYEELVGFQNFKTFKSGAKNFIEIHQENMQELVESCGKEPTDKLKIYVNEHSHLFLRPAKSAKIAQEKLKKYLEKNPEKKKQWENSLQEFSSLAEIVKQGKGKV